MGLFNKGPIVPVLKFSGAIGMSSPFKPGLSLATTAALIERAFSVKKAKAVAIVINSPGGSPVQSRLIFKRIRDLATEKKLKVYVFTEDVAASGGYMIAVAGDEIYVDPSSIVGSIGVISAGFGFEKLIDKVGVERRVHTAGKNKMSLDPFSPEKPEDITRLKGIQAEIHKVFIDLVKSRRGSKISAPDDEIFTGEFWAGEKAVELGLVDGISDVRTKMREIFGDKVRLGLVAPKRGMFMARPRPHVSFGSHAEDIITTLANGTSGDSINLVSGLSEDVISTLETRALWARFGL